MSTNTDEVSMPDAVAQCSGIEAFNISAPGSILDPSELSAPRSQHSLSHFLSSRDLRLMPPDIQRIGWKLIDMKERLLDKGRVFEAYKDLAGLAREALHFHRCE